MCVSVQLAEASLSLSDGKDAEEQSVGELLIQDEIDHNTPGELRGASVLVAMANPLSGSIKFR